MTVAPLLVALASTSAPLPAITLTEVLATSDVPAGVVNVLTGRQSETFPHLCKHMDVNAVAAPAGLLAPNGKDLQEATENLKRLRSWERLRESGGQGLHWIEAFQETKSVWHPVGI